VADIHDFIEASKNTDDALENLHGWGGAVEDSADDDRATAMSIALAGEAIAAAIREVGTRMDYVLRDLENRRP